MAIDFDELGPDAQELLIEMSEADRTFVKGYCEHGNASEAYVAGHPGVARTTAHAAASKTLKKPKIARLIEEVKIHQAKKWDVTESKILRAYAHLAFGDIREFYRPDGTLHPIPELPRHLADMVQSFEEEEIWVGQGENRQNIGTLKKMRLINRKDALDSLSRTQGLFIAVPKDKEKRKAQVVRFPAPVSKDDWENKHKA